MRRISSSPLLLSEALSDFPEEVSVTGQEVVRSTSSPKDCLVVIDDDPTGSQSISDLPIITSWEVADFDWAFSQRAPAIFVLLNTRAHDEITAGRLNQEAVRNALTSSRRLGINTTFVSRGDSTLRGHFPAETDAITAALESEIDVQTDAVILVPAFPGAGRITVDGVHYVQSGNEIVPVGETEFARDASFGFVSSALADYVEEKTSGQVRATDVIKLDLELIRSTPREIAQFLLQMPFGSIATADCVTINDLRMLSLGVAEAKDGGMNFVFRTGPTFVAAWIGQGDLVSVAAESISQDISVGLSGGLLVVGSHVSLTNSQLHQVRASFPSVQEVELPIADAIGEDFIDNAGAEIAISISKMLEANHVILRTGRALVTGSTPEESLAISRKVSDAVSGVVNQVLKLVRPKFVIAKGGITSHDIASKGLEVTRAKVVGPMLPGLVSLWSPVNGAAVGMPFVVFPGNVGDAHALAEVFKLLSTPSRENAIQ
jgi:uncharacterized protein YgbK (DUF1537 family)